MKGLLKSFVFAFEGLIYMIRSERNFRIHLIALLFITIMGFYFDIKNSEWLIILLISALVISLEIVNTAIEKLCDLYSTEDNRLIKIIKDISAASVLISALIAVGIAAIIFSKYI